MPPEPIITRWSTFINASNYYYENLKVIRKIIEKLDVDNTISIKGAKKCIFNNGIERDLAYIKSNFSILNISITELQKQGLPLADAINIMSKEHLKLFRN